jgi:hypothetical protein
MIGGTEEFFHFWSYCGDESSHFLYHILPPFVLLTFLCKPKIPWIKASAVGGPIFVRTYQAENLQRENRIYLQPGT